MYISIDGHTDSIGSYELNLKLGSDRAISVLNFLIYNVGMDPKTYDISANTYGEYKPIHEIGYIDNLELSDNRRIEIRIMPKFEELLKLVGSIE